MSRPKGPGAIKFLDPAKQDDVAIRRMLRRGAPPSPLEDKLNDLRTERAELTVQLINLRAQREGLRRRLSNAPMVRAQLEHDLYSVEKKINSAETALSDIEKQITRTKKQIAKLPRRRKAVFPWQEKAVQLIMLHKLLHTAGDALSTQGATITTEELQSQLLTEGFANVDERQLRRFMRHCEVVAGQQGRRTDLRLHVPESDDSDKREVLSLQRPPGMSDAEWTKTLHESVLDATTPASQLREQRRAEQDGLTEAQRKQRIGKRDAKLAKLAKPKFAKFAREVRAKQQKAAQAANFGQ